MPKAVVSIRLDPSTIAALDQVGTAGSRSRVIEAIIEAFLEQTFQTQRDVLKTVRLTNAAELSAVSRRRSLHESQIDSRGEAHHTRTDERPSKSPSAGDAGLENEGHLPRCDAAQARDAIALLGDSDQEGR